MANLKQKIRFFALSALIFLLSALSVLAQDLEQIYNNLEEADFNYIFSLDPYQSDEYTKYIYSPYPLFRTGVNLIFKSKTIPAGYYLLTPREKDGKTYVLFKENGRVSYVIPVYKTQKIYDGFWEEKLPYEYQNFSQKTANKFFDYIGKKWGQRNKRTPIPKSYVEFNDGGEYWDMVLYYGETKYYLVFKKD